MSAPVDNPTMKKSFAEWHVGGLWGTVAGTNGYPAPSQVVAAVCEALGTEQPDYEGWKLEIRRMDTDEPWRPVVGPPSPFSERCAAAEQAIRVLEDLCFNGHKLFWGQSERLVVLELDEARRGTPESPVGAALPIGTPGDGWETTEALSEGGHTTVVGGAPAAPTAPTVENDAAAPGRIPADPASGEPS